MADRRGLPYQIPYYCIKTSPRLSWGYISQRLYSIFIQSSHNTRWRITKESWTTGLAFCHRFLSKQTKLFVFSQSSQRNHKSQGLRSNRQQKIWGNKYWHCLGKLPFPENWHRQNKLFITFKRAHSPACTQTYLLARLHPFTHVLQSMLFCLPSARACTDCLTAHTPRQSSRSAKLKIYARFSILQMKPMSQDLFPGLNVLL